MSNIENVQRLRSIMKNSIDDDDIILIVNKIKSSKALNGGFDKLEESIDELKADIKEIKNDILNPDTGLHSRIKIVDQKAEQSKRHWDNFSKILFMIVGVCLTILGKFVLGS